MTVASTALKSQQIGNKLGTHYGSKRDSSAERNDILIHISKVFLFNKCKQCKIKTNLIIEKKIFNLTY
jgi:hypothetical protein